MCSRKYKQSGYMDEEPREKRGAPRGPRPEREGPRGRGLGRPTATLFKCARCGKEQTLEGAVPFDAACDGCGSDLHTCTNCKLFDTSARFECRAEIPQRIAKKATKNECDLFEAKAVKGFAKEGPPKDGKSAFDALFDF